MKDADGTIERLLSGLRDAQPPAGIERRILEALDGMEVREASAPTSFWAAVASGDCIAVGGRGDRDGCPCGSPTPACTRG